MLCLFFVYGTACLPVILLSQLLCRVLLQAVGSTCQRRSRLPPRTPLLVPSSLCWRANCSTLTSPRNRRLSRASRSSWRARSWRRCKLPAALQACSSQFFFQQRKSDKQWCFVFIPTLRLPSVLYEQLKVNRAISVKQSPWVDGYVCLCVLYDVLYYLLLYRDHKFDICLHLYELKLEKFSNAAQLWTVHLLVYD